MSPDLLNLILGPLGALVVLALLVFALVIGKLLVPYAFYQREVGRADRWEELAGRAMGNTKELLGQSTTQLENQKRIFGEHAEMLVLLRAIREQQTLSQERDRWERDK